MGSPGAFLADSLKAARSAWAMIELERMLPPAAGRADVAAGSAAADTEASADFHGAGGTADAAAHMAGSVAVEVPKVLVAETPLRCAGLQAIESASRVAL